MGIAIFLRDSLVLENEIQYNFILSDNPIDHITKLLISDKYKDKILF
jgi:hypothetical protein